MSKGDFAIVGEGITDQIVLKNVLLGFFDDWDDDPIIVFEQPPNDATATAREFRRAKEASLPPPGGWTLVLQYFDQRKFLQALQNNRYLVVQIDTDVAEQYDVHRNHGASARSGDEMVAAVIAELRRRIGEALWSEVGSRLLFAIGVDSIECWLLPLLFDWSRSAKRKKMTGCLEDANHELKRQKRAPLSDFDGSHKEPAAFAEVARGFQKGSALRALKPKNPGLSSFLAQLEAAKIQPVST